MGITEPGSKAPATILLVGEHPQAPHRVGFLLHHLNAGTILAISQLAVNKRLQATEQQLLTSGNRQEELAPILPCKQMKQMHHPPYTLTELPSKPTARYLRFPW